MRFPKLKCIAINCPIYIYFFCNYKKNHNFIMGESAAGISSLNSYHLCWWGGEGWNAIRYQILYPLNNQISDIIPHKNFFWYNAFANNQISGLKNQISGLKNQISGFKNQISGIRPPKKNQLSDITPPKKSNIRYQGTPVTPPPPHVVYLPF